MNRHLTEEQILDLLAPGAQRGPEIRRHLAGCPECRARLESEEPLSERLDALAREVDPPRDLWPDVRKGIAEEGRRRAVDGNGAGGGRSRWVRPALQAAAAAAVFALGTAVGRSLPSGTPEAGPGTAADPLVAAADVQRAGTEYVAAIARFRATASDAPAPAVDQARDVVLATVHGAAWELARLSPRDPTARDLMVLVGERARGQGAP